MSDAADADLTTGREALGSMLTQLSDKVDRPVFDVPEAAPAESVQLESKAEWQQAALDRGVPLDIDRPLRPDEVAELANKGRAARDDLHAREMNRDLNKQRERDGRGTLANMGDGRFYDQAAGITEVKAPKGTESWKSVEALTADTTFNRRLGVYQQQLNAGHDPATAEAIAMRDGQFEPSIPTLINDKGEIISHLGRSMEAGDTTFDNVYSATRALARGREAAAAALEADLAEYRQPETAEPQTNLDPNQSLQEPQQTQPQGPSPEIVAQQDVLNRQQNALAVQAAAMQLTQEERALVARNQQWDRWLDSVPEARSWEAWEATRTNHPERFAQVVKGFEQARNAKSAIARRAGELTEIRQNRSMQWQAAQNAALAARNEAWDNQAHEYLKTLPEYVNNKQQFHRAVREHLKSTGMTDRARVEIR